MPHMKTTSILRMGGDVLDCISMRLKARSCMMCRFIVPDACVWNHVSLTSRWFYLNCCGNKDGAFSPAGELDDSRLSLSPITH